MQRTSFQRFEMPIDLIPFLRVHRKAVDLVDARERVENDASYVCGIRYGR